MSFDFFEGPAGSGKTFSMVACARYLVENNVLAEDQRVLALTFMNGARRRLSESMSKEPVFRRRFDCLTFDSFALTLAQRRETNLTLGMRQKAERLGQFHGPCYLAAELLKDANVRSWVARTYPLVMVDEAQDLDENRQGIIRGLADSCAAVVAADAFQCLADGQETAGFFGWLKRAGTTHPLSQSHRTNKQGLLAAALAVRDGKSIKDVLQEKPIGRKGRVHWVGEGIELSEVPARANNPGLLAWSIAFQLTRGEEDVAILTPDSKNAIIRNAITSVNKKPWNWPKGGTFGPFSVIWEGTDANLANTLSAALELPEVSSHDEICALLEGHSTNAAVLAVCRRVRRIHRVTGQNEFTNDQILEFISDAIRNATRLGLKKNARIKAMSIHGAKNREFDRVIVLWPQSATGSAEYKRRLLYNGMTRAKTHCTILVLGSKRLDEAPFATQGGLALMPER